MDSIYAMTLDQCRLWAYMAGKNKNKKNEMLANTMATLLFQPQ